MDGRGARPLHWRSVYTCFGGSFELCRALNAQQPHSMYAGTTVFCACLQPPPQCLVAPTHVTHKHHGEWSKEGIIVAGAVLDSKTTFRSNRFIYLGKNSSGKYFLLQKFSGFNFFSNGRSFLSQDVGSIKCFLGLNSFPGATNTDSAVDPRFWSEGPSGVLTLVGAMNPKFAWNRGFPLKLPENCMILKKSWGQGGPGPPGPPWIRYWDRIGWLIERLNRLRAVEAITRELIRLLPKLSGFRLNHGSIRSAAWCCYLYSDSLISGPQRNHTHNEATGEDSVRKPLSSVTAEEQKP